MQKAEVAGAAVTPGQDVLQDQAEKFHAAHVALFDPFGLAVPVAERHPAIFVGQDCVQIYLFGRTTIHKRLISQRK